MSYKQGIITVLLTGLLLSGCTKTPDVRLTFCQDLTWLLQGSPEKMEWQAHHPIIKGYDDLEMQIHFATFEHGEKNNGQSVCFYRYEEDGISDIASFQNPMAAYSTYPHKMIFKGQMVDKNLLTQTIHKLTELSIKETMKRVISK